MIVSRLHLFDERHRVTAASPHPPPRRRTSIRPQNAGTNAETYREKFSRERYDQTQRSSLLNRAAFARQLERKRKQPPRAESNHGFWLLHSRERKRFRPGFS